eukprot:CAMPEP_0171181476 /NCGR_PEP_ID=MMETSP0790-20130122/14279_1 /TAXON_ID=2925 /ORGANISM="Alexandrium catenella, Strain OF101" /LENGTH=251 /DNA_ID=CAMNT_0011646415 /DNA_START=80 /DNA_END=835 /DNA_ORIENTATION=-
MYLIFQGVGACCKLPGKGCGACADLCKQMNCTGCRSGCKAMQAGCSSFVEKPLSSFVIITGLMSIVEIVQLGSTFASHSLYYCTFPKSAFVGVTGWVGVQMGFALLNLLFAPYFQYKVWEQLFVASEAEEKLKTQAEVPVEKDVVQGSFKYVFMHDLGVCFYFFALVASFVWSKYGFDWVMSDPKKCNPNGGLSIAANIGWAFFYVAVLYVLMWYCCGCCAKETKIRGGYEDPEAEADPEGYEKPLNQDDQ